MSEEQPPNFRFLPGVSVVVPVYDSEGTLRELCQRLVTVFEARNTPFEIILVNDGSRDGSWERIGELSGEIPQVRGVRLIRNFGQHNALLCGIRLARHEVTLTLDDDLQNPPEEIPRLLDSLGQGFDVVYGTPEAEQHGFWRDHASRISKLVLQNAMGADVARKISAFRAFRTRVREAFKDYRGDFVSIDVLLTWATTRFTAVTVRHDPRRIGSSHYTVRRLVTHALNMMTGFSTLPLQLASVAGLGAALFGILVLIFVIGRTLIQGAAVPGFAFLATTIAIFSGVQLFSIGIIGEYLGRIHMRTMDRPSYVVDEATSHGDAE